MISLLNGWGAAWAGWFLPALIQDTVFLGLVFLALHLLRKASPSRTHRIRGGRGVALVGVAPAFGKRGIPARAREGGTPPRRFVLM